MLRLGLYGGRQQSSVQVKPLEVGISQSLKAVCSDDGQLKQKNSWVPVSFTTKGKLLFLRLGGVDNTLACPNEAAGDKDGPLYLVNKDQKFASAQPVEIEFALVSTLVGLTVAALLSS